jgi:xylitol oxidase
MAINIARWVSEDMSPTRHMRDGGSRQVETMIESNWAKNYTYRTSALHHPQTIAELQRIVAGSSNVHALGTRHSFNDIADAGDLVSLTALESELDIDRSTMTVTVGAGVRYGVLASHLELAGYALHNMGSLPHISVGGATATATHGSGNHNRNLAAAIRSLEVISSEGDIVSYRREDQDFAGMVVHLGALGIVTRLTLDIEPSYTVSQEVLEGLSWDALTGSFDAVFGSAYSVSVFTSFAAEAGVLWRKHRLDQSAQPGSVPHWDARPAPANRHPVDGLDGTTCTPQMLEPGAWCERLPHFRLDQVPASGAEIQSEYMLDRKMAVAAIDALRDFEPRMRNLLMVAEIRTIAADDLWLSTAHGYDTVAFHFSWFLDQEGVERLLPELEAVLAPFAARPHWGKAFAMGANAIDRLYPQADAFRRLRRSLDPRGAFVTPYLERTGLV